MRRTGQYPLHVCGRISVSQMATLQAICDLVESETHQPAKLVDGLRFLLDSKQAKNLAKKAP